MRSARFKLMGGIAGGFCALSALAGCMGGQGSTDGGSGADGGFRDDVFVSDETTVGGMSLVLASSSLGIGDTASFSTFVTNADGSGVPQMNVACDSEDGVAIIEPQRGFELTDSSGVMTGQIGCEKPGSFQLVCRLTTGASRRKFATVNCTGEIPSGFQGFPGAAGGGLGGGTQTNDDGDVRIISAFFEDDGNFDSSSGSGASVDISGISDCDLSTPKIEVEPFYDTYVVLGVKNNLSEQVRFTSFRYSVSDVDGRGTEFTSKSLGLTQESESTLAADGGSSNIIMPIFKAYNGAKYAGDPMGSGIRISNRSLQTVTFELTGETASGESVSISARATASFGDFDRCTN
ncbi:MAG: hypothetical protein ACK5Y6_05720 [Pseudomonadota bacterium]